MTVLAVDRRDRDVAILALVVIAVFAFFLSSEGLPTIRRKPLVASFVLFFFVAMFWAAGYILKILLVDRPAAATKKIAETFFQASLLPRYISAIVILVALIAFMPAFSAMKSAVPVFNNYSWDSTFIEFDRRLHGRDAWRLLQPLVGYPMVTSFLSGLYHLWLMLLYFGTFYFLLHKNPVLRQRYFISYLLCWSIIGAGLAIVFSSVGPCFVEPIVGRTDFAPLMDYLKAADQQYPVLVLNVQDLLLARHQDADSGLGSGITAMPSMHVAQAFLFFLAARHISRRAAWIFGIFFAAIMVGSVHLAYHYAVDGYVAIIATAFIWKCSGWWALRRTRSETLVAA
jgi:PAP2 superfamily